jgi:ParB-like chromosome segregation protein Spo0J
LYPPLIVRPHPRSAGKFEILDGRQRLDVLRELGFSSARCEIWTVDDYQAELYAATLNHLRSRPVVTGRARQVRRLIRRYTQKRVEQLLAMTPAAIRQQLIALRAPEESHDSVRPLDLQCVVFHLPAAAVRELHQALRRFDPAGKSKGDALMNALRTARKQTRSKGE